MKYLFNALVSILLLVACGPSKERKHSPNMASDHEPQTEEQMQKADLDVHMQKVEGAGLAEGAELCIDPSYEDAEGQVIEPFKAKHKTANPGANYLDYDAEADKWNVMRSFKVETIDGGTVTVDNFYKSTFKNNPMYYGIPGGPNKVINKASPESRILTWTATSKVCIKGDGSISFDKLRNSPEECSGYHNKVRGKEFTSLICTKKGSNFVTFWARKSGWLNSN